MVRVTLDIFSGRPNPSWVLGEREAREILRELAAQRDAVSSADEDRGVLGFRGLIVEADEGGEAGGLELPPRFRIAGGQSGNEWKGVEIAERLLAGMGRPFPATGLPTDVGVYDDLDLRRLAREGLQGVEGSASALSGPAAPGDVTAQAGATVIGTDASSWSTLTAGACQYEASAFNPNFWNGQRTVQRNNNCYNYASNRRTDTFAQPGRATGAQATVMACSNVTAGAVSDGAVQAPGCADAAQAPRHYMALVIWPGTDYHWYRHQSDGFWGHKPGQTAARNYDNSGNIIYSPETANRGGYTDFCGYFFGPKAMVVR